MIYDSDIHHRHSIRLKEYDYSENGFYYVTICIENKKCILGNIKNNEMKLNTVGQLIQKYWLELEKKFQNVVLDMYVVMPNHVHGIIAIENQISISVGAGLVPALARATTRVAPTKTLGNIIGAFKSITTHEYIKNVHDNHWAQFDKRLWQRNYYEHIIRNEKSLEKIREYIQKNPYTWEDDELFISD